jgi:Predicted permease
MVLFIAVIFRLTLTPRLVQEAKAHSEQGLMGRMEGHAAMDMSVSGGSFWQKLWSPKGFTAVSNYFVMDWASVWVDIVLGLLIAGALATWVPNSFWNAFFFSNNPTIAKIEGPLVGPFVSLVSFVCSVGNVPLAAVLWRGGISFGGVASFIFADLIILPILDIYRKYYGWKVMGYILVTFYVTMAAAGYVVELLFGALGIIPTNRQVVAISEGVQWNYTSGREYPLPPAGSHPGGTLSPHGWTTHAAHDEYTRARYVPARYVGSAAQVDQRSTKSIRCKDQQPLDGAQSANERRQTISECFLLIRPERCQQPLMSLRKALHEARDLLVPCLAQL